MVCNSRKDNLCVFCEHWLGKEAEVDIINGEAKINSKLGLCSEDGEQHKEHDLCRFFKRNLIYM